MVVLMSFREGADHITLRGSNGDAGVGAEAKCPSTSPPRNQGPNLSQGERAFQGQVERSLILLVTQIAIIIMIQPSNC